jgi:hypothetical protein
MHDRDLRRALLANLRRTFASDPSTLIVEEMGLCQGKRRVDVAVVNGLIHGYEIKSDADDLSRLPAQLAVYGAVLDRMTLVASPSHVGAASDLVPEWWGITIAEPGPARDVTLTAIRGATRNGQLDPNALVQLLWRDEAIALLRRHEPTSSPDLERRPRRFIWAALAEAIPVDDLGVAVRTALKARRDWRAAD